jgi:hypothetical protein
MLTRLINGVNARDPSICTQVYTDGYRERLMERQGAAALAACHKEVRGASYQAALVRIERVALHRAADGRVTGPVRVVERIGTSGLLRVNFVVVRTPSGYRVDGATGTQTSTPGSATPATGTTMG